MPKETSFAADVPPDAPSADAAPPDETPAKDAPKASPTATWVVMHDSVSNWVRGCRVTIDSVFHKDHPTRDHEWARLVRLGAIKPESDPEAAAVPVAEPLSSPPPIMMATPNGQLTVSLPAPKKV